jgi:hypothetical protein
VGNNGANNKQFSHSKQGKANRVTIISLVVAMKDLSSRNSVPFGILYNFVVRIWFNPLLGEKILLEILTMYTHVEKHFL